MTTKHDAIPFYRHILNDAWRLTITHRHLMVFGFFATFAGFGGVSEILFGLHDRMTSGLAPIVAGSGADPWMIIPGLATLSSLLTISPHPFVSLLIFLAGIILFFVVFAWVVSTAIGALVGSIRLVERGRHPKLVDGINIGQRSAWRVFLLNLSAKLLIAVIFVFTGANLIQLLRTDSLVSGFFYFLAFVAFTIFSVMVTIISIYATNSTVIENLPFVPAIADGLHILKRHWLVNIEMVILLLLVNVGLAVLALLAAMILAVPLIFLFLFAALVKSTTLLTIMVSITAITLLAVIALIGSFATTFQASCWTLLWIRLSGRTPHVPKLHRLTTWIQKKFRG